MKIYPRTLLSATLHISLLLLMLLVPSKAHINSESNGESVSDETSSSSCSNSDSGSSSSSGSCSTAYVNPSAPDIMYDFIIIGGGSSGCVLANRLTENPEWNVLLIEAGSDINPTMEIPYTTSHLQLAKTNWKFKAQQSETSCLGMEQGQCNIPSGKVLGGSTVLDYMFYCRGNPADFDAWEANGNEGWGYESVLPYFLKSENNKIPELIEDREHHATGGPVSVSYAQYRTSLAEAFIEAGRESGMNVIDYNGENQIGVSYTQTTTNNGTRWSARRAYIDSIQHRKNLFIQLESVVIKILIENKVAIGVEFIHGNQKYVVYAKKEVIIAAGALNSPQILMLSGIGPEEHLKKLGIRVIKDLKVGYNLQDHVSTGILMFSIKGKASMRSDDVLLNPNNYEDYIISHSGPLTSTGGLEAIAFIDTKSKGCNSSSSVPDIMLMFGSVSVVSDPTYRLSFSIGCDTYDAVYKPVEKLYSFTILPVLLNQKSKGRIMLKNRDPSEPPLIQTNYFAEKDDLDTFVSGIRRAIQLSETEAFRKFGSKLNDIPIPECANFEFGSDEYWKCASKQITFVSYNQCGTCKMGPHTDKDAVVDPELKVMGISQLRVVGAASIPAPSSCYINAAVYMQAEKAADMIKMDWGYI